MARPKKNVEEVKENKNKNIKVATIEDRVKRLEDELAALRKDFRHMDECVSSCLDDLSDDLDELWDKTMNKKEEKNDLEELIELFDEEFEKREEPKKENKPVNVVINTYYRRPFNFFEDFWF